MLPWLVYRCRNVEKAPALSPQLCSFCQCRQCGANDARQAYTVTLEGSPPNGRMNLCTHRRAARSDRQVSDKYQNSKRMGRRLTIMETQIANARVLDLLSAKKAEDVQTGSCE